MSRRHLLLEVMGMTYGDLSNMYHELGTIRAVCARLGVSRRSVINWMREGNIVGTKHAHRHLTKRRTTALFEWIAAHPDVRLPTNVRGIAAQTQLPAVQVKAALLRRARAVRTHLMSLQPLMLGRGTFIASDGRTLPVAAVATYSLRVNMYSLRVHLEGELRNGDYFEAVMTRVQYAQLCD